MSARFSSEKRVTYPVCPLAIRKPIYASTTAARMSYEITIAEGFRCVVCSDEEIVGLSLLLLPHARRRRAQHNDTRRATWGCKTPPSEDGADGQWSESTRLADEIRRVSQNTYPSRKALSRSTSEATNQQFAPRGTCLDCPARVPESRQPCSHMYTCFE